MKSEAIVTILSFMILSRNQFFLLLFGLLPGPFFVHKIVWLATSRKTTGTMQFTGHGNFGSVLGISSYPVIRFTTGKDTVYFNGNLSLNLKPGETIAVRYKENAPSDAKVNTFTCIWGDTLAYALGPLLVFLAIFFMPDIIPRKSMIRLGGRPFVRIIP